MADTEIVTAPVTTPAKPGYKTTEFWLSTAAMIIGTLWASGTITDGGNIDKVLGLLAMILTALGYTVARGMAKTK